MTKYIIGDLLTGRRIQILPDVISGPWSDQLNSAGAVSVDVPSNNPGIKRMSLMNSATPGKSFLAALDGDTVLQAGPIWTHDYDDDAHRITLTAAGMWSYFDHRVLLPVLAGRNPTDVTTDTRWQNISTDPDNPWATDTSKSYQGMVRDLVAQAQSFTNGNVPVILPTEIPGENEKWYKGVDLGFVGQRISDLTGLENGPDVRFAPRLTADRQGIEWVLQIGTPTQPMLYGAIAPTFNVSTAKSSVSGLRVNVDGTALASQSFGVGGRSSDKALISLSNDSTLLNAGFPLLEVVDSAHSTVTESATLQGYSDALVARGKTPLVTVSFDHDLTRQPSLGGFNVGDFALVKFRRNDYFGTAAKRWRITGRSGDAQGRKVSLTFQPEVL